ncbi:CueP family metal-binding protein [Piscibacillus salipiscarius]|uniref:CueP family metal-binding protein n=1 Tax=Piscibacillus salipiscarius TaxID=299480 RepID=A0ABW5QC34_9BACI
MKLKFLLTTILVSVILTGCGQSEEASSGDVDIKELVNDYSTDEITEGSASITSEKLIIQDQDGQEKIYDLPEDEFFVSIAPFVNQTHPCTNHSLTGCQGEMVEETFDVYIENQDGEVIVDKEMKTFKNGFFDLWLPREQTYNVTVKHDGKIAEQKISTYEPDGTCITTMRLS